MAKTNAKRNARTSKLRGCFKICREPVVRLGARVRSANAENVNRPRVYEHPVLFAIARDEHTIFVSWEVDWPSAFDKATPADRLVHLRLVDHDGFEQQTVTIEPMLGNCYVTVPQPRAIHHVELGYFRPDRGWQCVAISQPFMLAANVPFEKSPVDVATVPFHVTFQKLLDLLNLEKGDQVATALSRLEDGILTFAERDVDLPPAGREILRAVDGSIDNLRAARLSFDERPQEVQLGKRAEAILTSSATSPTRQHQRH